MYWCRERIFSQQELADAGAVATYADARDLMAHLTESPIGRIVGSTTTMSVFAVRPRSGTGLGRT